MILALTRYATEGIKRSIVYIALSINTYKAISYYIKISGI